MSERFRFRFRVRYNECDAQLVVFNARYADYVDLAMTEFMRSLGRDYKALLARGLDNQVVKMTLEWQ
ncbi:MAG TPA: acyl-CoA thioesterase, partial [Alcanivorax sp.]|nr:acyl-CoA thioesterase [Alcanivorax sp.]